MMNTQSFSSKCIAVCGMGNMGRWIASALEALDTPLILFDVDSNQLQKVKCLDAGKHTHHYTSDIRELSRADHILETIPENLELKIEFYRRIDALMHPTAIVTSNTSIFDPRDFLRGFSRPNRFSCFHFYTPRTIVDIMPLPETDADVVDYLKALAEKMGEEPFILQAIKPGYVFSSLAGALTDNALTLVIEQVSPPADIDHAWKKITGMAVGPLGMLDRVGLDTSLHIRRARLAKDPNDAKLRAQISLLEEYVAKGYLGVKSGRGFHQYGSP